jgi:hypothetical protein
MALDGELDQGTLRVPEFACLSVYISTAVVPCAGIGGEIPLEDRSSEGIW